MTLPPSKVGDRGQRFMVEGFNYPTREEWHPIAYTNDLDMALKLFAGMPQPPGMQQIRITDRQLSGRK